MTVGSDSDAADDEDDEDDEDELRHDEDDEEELQRVVTTPFLSRQENDDGQPLPEVVNADGRETALYGTLTNAISKRQLLLKRKGSSEFILIESVAALHSNAEHALLY